MKFPGVAPHSAQRECEHNGWRGSPLLPRTFAPFSQAQCGYHPSQPLAHRWCKIFQRRQAITLQRDRLNARQVPTKRARLRQCEAHAVDKAKHVGRLKREPRLLLGRHGLVNNRRAAGIEKCDASDGYTQIRHLPTAARLPLAQSPIKR